MEKNVVKQQVKDLKEDIPTKWNDLTMILRDHFLQSNGERMKIFFSYTWVVLDEPKRPSDSISDIQKFGTEIDGVKLLDCQIQDKLTRFKRYLEDIGFQVHMDIHSNNHGGGTLDSQIEKKITEADIRICFLTPVYKAKVEYTGKEPCVIRREYELINRCSGPTYRFILIGNLKNASPVNWESFLCTKQEHKSELDQLKFIVEKMLVKPDSNLRENKDFFHRMWAMIEDKGQNVVQHDAERSPVIKSASDIDAALRAQPRKSKVTAATPARSPDVPLNSFKMGDLDCNEANLVSSSTKSSSSSVEVGNVTAKGKVNIFAGNANDDTLKQIFK